MTRPPKPSHTGAGAETQKEPTYMGIAIGRLHLEDGLTICLKAPHPGPARCLCPTLL